jgi:hypothetical protein
MAGSAACMKALTVQELVQITAVEISLNPHKDKTGTARETERIHKEGRQIPVSREMAGKHQVHSRAVVLALELELEQAQALGQVMAKAMEPQRTPPRIMQAMAANRAVQQLRQQRLRKLHPQLQANTRRHHHWSPRVGGSGSWTG